MRRSLATFVIIALGAGMATGTALAQEADPSGLTGLEPLSQIVEGFVAGQESDGLYLQGENDSGPTGLAQFQVIVNMGGGSAFGEQDVEMVPSGLSADGDLASLEEIFGGTLGGTSLLPPLAPFARGQAMDLTEMFDGWTAYGNAGLVEGPVQLNEGKQVVAGIELAEPYDSDCSETTYVGRAWVGSTVSAPDPLFSADALADRYAGTDHSALAGRASRLIELACFPGGGPVMVSSRMREGSGIRPFGPLEILGLVNGNHVVIIAPIRVLDADLTQRFYTSPPEGGDVVVSEVEDAPRLLVPNPYGPDDVRLEIQRVADPVDTDTTNAGGDVGDSRTLLYQGDDGAVLPVQSGGLCAFIDHFLYLLGLGSEIFGGNVISYDSDSYAFGPATSSSGPIAVEDGKLMATTVDKGGATQELVVNSDGTGTVSVTRPGGVPCELPVMVSSIPNIFDDAGDTSGDSGDSTSDESDDEQATDESADDGSADEDNGGAGGVPWGPIGLAIVLIGIAAGTAYNRRQTRTRDCVPEEQAYAAAAAAYEKAKKASDYYIGEFNHYNSEYNDYNRALQNRLGEPDRVRGYPEGADGDKAYTAAKADWDAQEARAERAEHNVNGAREVMEGAKRDMDEAIKAQDTAADLLEQAREALRACKGSAPESPAGETPPSSPSSPGGETPTSPGTIDGGTADRTEPECLEGTTKVKIESQQSFEIMEGDVEIHLNKTKLNSAYPGGLIGPDVLKSLSEGDLQDLFSQLEENVEKETMRWAINTTMLTVKCIRIVVCQGGRWVETDQTNRVEERAAGSSYHDATKTQSKVLAQRFMASAKLKITELQANEAAAAAFTCD